jgi:HK97 family phage portal protein
MSFFDRIAAAGRALVGRADYSDYHKQLTDVGWFGTGGLSLAAGACRNTRAWLETLNKHPRLASAANRIATDGGKTRWFLLEDDRKTGKPREVTEHPFLKFMAAPWRTAAGGSWCTVIYLIIVYLLIDGNAFLRLKWKNPDKKGPPDEIWPISPHLVASVPRKGQPYYLLAAGVEEACDRIPPGEMLWLRRPNPLDPFGRGWGVAQTLDDEVSQDEWAAKYNNSWFRNGARPDLLISIGEANPLERKRIEESWKSKYRGIANAFKTFFLTSDAKVHNLATTHKDMQWTEGRKLLRDIIFQTFGLPPEVMGVVENSNRATAEAALYLYSLQCILPMVSNICDELNRLLLPLFFVNGRSVYLGFESPVRETEEFRLNKATELFKCGAITRNQCLETVGYDPAPGARGEEYLVPVNMQAVGPNDSSSSESAEKPAKRNVVKIFAPRGGVISEIEMERAA